MSGSPYLQAVLEALNLCRLPLFILGVLQVLTFDQLQQNPLTSKLNLECIQVLKEAIFQYSEGQNNNKNLYLHYSGRRKRKEEKKQSIENKIMEDL